MFEDDAWLGSLAIGTCIDGIEADADWGALSLLASVFVYGLGAIRFHLLDNDQLLTWTV